MSSKATFLNLYIAIIFFLLYENESYHIITVQLKINAFSHYTYIHMHYYTFTRFDVPIRYKYTGYQNLNYNDRDLEKSLFVCAFILRMLIQTYVTFVPKLRILRIKLVIGMSRQKNVYHTMLQRSVFVTISRTKQYVISIYYKTFIFYSLLYWSHSFAR